VIGLQGLPHELASAGNVLYKELTFRCSMRIPPRLSSKEIVEKLRTILTAEGPETFGAKIEFSCDDFGDGFDAPDLPEHIKTPLNEATAEIFGGNKPLYVGSGGSIPFMEVFSDLFPGSNFLLTGVGFSDSNAHSANENLRLEYCRKLTTMVSVMLSKFK